MTNPLDTGTGGRGRDTSPGEFRMVSVRQWNDGKLGDSMGTLTIQRTTRAYVHDLCDGYNSMRSEASKAAGLEWFVTPGGDLRFGTTGETDTTIHKRAMRALRSIDRAELDRAA